MAWEPLVIVASLWLAAGMTFANILYRRGHDGWHWMLVCAIAGPLAALIVADQARFVEPQSASITVTRAEGHAHGTTVVIPSAAIGHLDESAVRAAAGRQARIVIAAPVAYEHLTDGWTHAELAAANALDDARDRFGNHPIDVVVTPGAVPHAVVSVAAERAPAVVLTSQAAHPPSTLARLARLVARQPGVGLSVHAPTPAPTASTAA